MRVFGNQHPSKIDDPVFGLIIHKRNIWSHIPDAETDGFMVTIDAPITGPSDMQREHFQKIQSALVTLRQQSLAFIKMKARKSVDARGLSIYSVGVGDDEDCQKERFVLEFSEENADLIHRVSFDGGQPKEYGFDD
jgi:hypothetical protein